MENNLNQFKKDSKRVAFDLEHRRKIKFNIGKYDLAVSKGTLRYHDQEMAKNRAGYIKRQSLDQLPELLEIFESNISSNGAEVIWARNSEEALAFIEQIVQQEQVKMVVKSKSMTTEEIELNDHLESCQVIPWETDLGEFIVQLEGEKPYHIVTPAMHKSKEDVDSLFHRKFNTKEGSTPEELTLFVRHYLREKFCQAELGVTGANFLIADTGSIALTENEGNALLTVSFPRIHIVIAGIEKIVPSLNHMGLFWPLLASLGTGQQISVYSNLISGPRKENEVDGPEKMFVILLDNGRSDLYEEEHLYQGLACIRCGACLNACPIYKNIGGYTYATTYSGPIGSIITPHFKGFKEFKHLSFASTLCGKCAEVCPVKIPIPDLLLENRHKSVDMNFAEMKERLVVKGASMFLRNRKMLDLLAGKQKRKLSKWFLSDALGDKKRFPDFPDHSFQSQWKTNTRQ